MARQYRYVSDAVENFQLILEKYTELLALLSKNSGQFSDFVIVEQETIQKVIKAILDLLSQAPHVLMQIYVKMNLNYFHILSQLITESYTLQHVSNDQHQNIENIITLQSKCLKSCYDEFSSTLYELLDNLDLDNYTKRSLLFHVKLLLETLHPDHSIVFNKLMLSKGINTNWQYVVDVLNNIILDLKDGKTFLDISTIHMQSFVVGQNIAATKGKVIYRNDLMELIFYQPLQKVRSVPIFIVPPCINKYYILDLSSHNSFVQWLVENHFEVFIVSWINPDQSLRNKTFDDYIQEGILNPVAHIKSQLKYEQISAIGYCIGGTLLGCAAAFAETIDVPLFNSMTLLASLLDFSKVGDIEFFLNQTNLATLKKNVNKNGYLSGKILNYAFSLLRSKELIWNFVVNNYFAGKQPPAFDILYWNADATNIPETMYLFYIDNFYINNLLATKDGLSIFDTKLNLGRIQTPIFYLGAQSDHIVQWEGAYKSMQLLSGSTNKTFCLTTAGHIAGVLNHPKSNKYSYYVAENLDNVSCETFIPNATRHNGSWWNCWLLWQRQYSGTQGASHRYRKLCQEYICDAPGIYVNKRI